MGIIEIYESNKKVNQTKNQSQNLVQRYETIQQDRYNQAMGIVSAVEKYSKDYDTLAKNSMEQLNRNSINEYANQFKEYYKNGQNILNQTSNYIFQNIEQYRDILGDDYVNNTIKSLASANRNVNEQNTQFEYLADYNNYFDLKAQEYNYKNNGKLSGEDYYNTYNKMINEYSGNTRSDIEKKISNLEQEKISIERNISATINTDIIDENGGFIGMEGGFKVKTPVTTEDTANTDMSEEEQIRLQEINEELEKYNDILNTMNIIAPDENGEYAFFKQASDYEEMVSKGKNSEGNKIIEEIKSKGSVGVKDIIFLGAYDDIDSSWVRYLSEDEKNTYHYLLGKYGTEKANEYAKTLEETGNYRIAENVAANNDENNKSLIKWIGGDTGAHLGRAVESGLESFGANIGQIFDDEARATLPSEYLTAINKENAGKLEGFFIDVAQNMGNNLPSMVLSAVPGIGQVAGTGSFFASAYGSALKEAKDMGADSDQQMLYALASATAEVTTEKVLGGLKGLSNNTLSQTVRNAMKDNVKSAVLRAGSELGASALSEATEEYIQAILEPVFQNAILDEDNNISLISEDAIYSALIGAVSAGTLNSVSVIATTKTYASSGKDIKEQGNVEELIDYAMKLEGTKAYELASEIKKGNLKETDYNIGELAAEIQSEINKSARKIEDNNTEIDTPVGFENIFSDDAVVKLSNGKTKKLSETNMDETMQSLYSTAAIFDDKTANALVENYNGKVDVSTYVNEMIKYRKLGRDNIDIIDEINNNPLADIIGRNALTKAYEAGMKYQNEMTSKDQMKVVKTIGEALGVKVNTYTDSGNSNGYYKDNEVYINTTTDNPALAVMAHEVTHHMQNTANVEYQAYKSLVIDYLVSTDVDGYNERVRKLEELYKKSGQNITEEQIEDEIVANAASDFLFDEKVIEQVVAKDKNIAQNIIVSIKKIISKIKEKIRNYNNNSYEARTLRQSLETLEKAKELWIKGLKASEKGNNLKKGEQVKNQLKEKVIDYANEVINDKNSYHKPLIINTSIPIRLANDIKKLLGLDIKADECIQKMTPSYLLHIEKRHGINGIADHSMKDINDYGEIATICEEYTNIEVGNESKGLRNSDGTFAKKIVLSKDIEKGTMYVVEAVPILKNNFELQVVSAYIKAKKEEVQARNTYGPAQTSKNEVASSSSKSSLTQQKNNGQEKFSLKEIDKDGIEVYEISDDIKKLTLKEKKKIFLRKMKEEYKDKTITFKKNGITYNAVFDNASLNKIIYGDKNSSKRGYKDKINLGAEGDIFEVIENRKFIGSSKEHGKITANGIHEKTLDWNYYIKTIFVDGNYFDVLTNIRKTGNYYVYDISLRNTSRPEYMKKNHSSLPTGSVYGKNISQSKNNSQGKFSLKETEEVQDIIKENEKLKETVSILEQELTLTHGMIPNKNEIKALASKIIKDNSSMYSKEVLEQNLTEFFTFIHKKKGKVDTNNIIRIAASIIKPVLMKSQTADYGMYNKYSSLRNYLKNTAISLSDAQKREIEYTYDDYNSFRKSMFGTLKLSDNGSSLDVIWDELSGLYPEFFSSSASETEMIPQIIEALEAIKPQIINPYGMNIDQYSVNMALQLFDDISKVSSMQTKADKIEAQNKDKIEYQWKKIDELRRELRFKIAETRKEAKSDYEAKLRKIKQEYANKKMNLQTGVLEAKARNYNVQKQRYQDRLDKTKYRKSIFENSKKLITWINAPSEKNYVPDDLKHLVLDVLNNIDFISSRASAGSDSTSNWKDKMRLIASMLDKFSTGTDDVYYETDPDFLPTVNEFIDSINKPTYDKKGRPMDNTRKISDMSVNQLRQLDYILRSMKKTITESNKLRSVERYETIAEIGEKTMSTLNDKKDIKYDNFVNKLLNIDMLDPIAYFEQFGDGGKAIFDSLQNGEDKKINLIDEAIAYTQELFEKNEVDVKELATTIKTIKIRGQEVKMSTAQIMNLYELSKRPQALEHLIAGGFRLSEFVDDKIIKTKINDNRIYHVTEGEIENITSELTEDEKRIADKMQEFLGGTCSEWGNEVSQELYEYDKFGDVNYWPIKTAQEFTKTNDENSQQFSLNKIKNMGFTKKTVPKSKNPIIIGDIFDVYSNHIDEMATYSGMVIPIMDAMKWFNYTTATSEGEETEVTYESVKNMITQKYGKNMNDYFIKLIQDINGGTAKEYSISDKLIKNFKVASVAGNLRVAIQQPTAYIRAVMEISPKYLIKGMKSNGENGAKKMKKYAPIAKWKSWGFFDTNLGNTISQVITGKQTLTEKIQDKTLWLAGKADDITWGRLWNACEYEQRAKHSEWSDEKIYAATGKRMTEIVHKTQVVDSVLNKSQIMRSNHALTKMEMSFMNEPVKTYNMLRSAITTKNKNTILRAGAVFLTSSMINAMVQSLIDAARDDDETKEYLEKYADNLLDNFLDNASPISMIPYVKDIVTLTQGYDIQRNDMLAITNLWNGAEKLYKYITNPEYRQEKPFYSVAFTFVQGFSQLSGIPAANIMREVKTGTNTISRATSGKNAWETQTPTFTDKYERLYEAITTKDADTRKMLYDWLYDNGKTADDITSSLKKYLKEDERIIEAAEARANGDFATYNKIVQQYLGYGFSKDTLNTITNTIIKNKSEELATSQAEGEKVDMDTSIYSGADIKRLVTLGKYGDMQEIITDLYNVKYQELKVEEELESEEEYIKKAKQSIRSTITSNVKSVYVAASSSEKAKIKNMLLSLKINGEAIYESETIDKWDE